MTVQDNATLQVCDLSSNTNATTPWPLSVSLQNNYKNMRPDGLYITNKNMSPWQKLHYLT